MSNDAFPRCSRVTMRLALAAAVAIGASSSASIVLAQATSGRAPATASSATGNAGTAATAQAMPRGVVPNRAELSGSAFQKLDTDNKGYVTLDDVRQLSGFESAFRQADQNRDGRLNPSEFNSAWAIYTGNTP